MSSTYSILFVCLGNICRSPLAEAVMAHLAAGAEGPDLHIDSAGTSAWHAGEPADPRTIDVARRHGIAVTSRSRQVGPHDFEQFDLLIAMDADNRRNLLALCPPAHRQKIRLLREWDPQGAGDVPDPYFGGDSGFEDSFEMVQRCCQALLTQLGE